MKTILHILNTDRYSGAENVAITIINYFNKYSSEYRLIYVSKDGPIRHILDNNKIEFEPITSICRSEVRRVVSKWKPDIIHAHDFTASIYFAVFANSPIVISHIHNNLPWLKRINKNSLIFCFSCFKYKYILGVSPSVFDEFVFGHIFKNKEKVIGNPIDTSVVREKAKESTFDEEYDVVFLGRLAYQKNPLKFLSIISNVKDRIPNIKVAMIGEGELEQEVKDRILSLSLGDTVEMKGFMNNPYGILEKSRLLCMTSDWEGFGLVAVEALSLGVPVVASPVGGIPTIICGNEGKLCNSEKEFSDEICQILTDEKYLKMRKQAALQRADELNNIDIYMSWLKDIYSH